MSFDHLGPTGEFAADYAAKHGGEYMNDVEESARQQVCDAIAQGIREMRGVEGTARLIRKVIPAIPRPDALSLAANIMAHGFSEAELQDMRRRGRTHKRSIASYDCCPTCKANQKQGAIPVDQPFKSGHLRTPFHDDCRCCINAARPPEED